MTFEQPRRLGPPIRNLKDLHLTDHLSPHEDREVIRAAKEGDPNAIDRFARCFYKAVKKAAGTYSGPVVAREARGVLGPVLFRAARDSSLMPL